MALARNDIDSLSNALLSLQLDNINSIGKEDLKDLCKKLARFRRQVDDHGNSLFDVTDEDGIRDVIRDLGPLRNKGEGMKRDDLAEILHLIQEILGHVSEAAKSLHAFEDAYKLLEKTVKEL